MSKKAFARGVAPHMSLLRSLKVGDKAVKAMRRRKLHRRSDLALADITRWTRPILLGWVND